MMTQWEKNSVNLEFIVTEETETLGANVSLGALLPARVMLSSLYLSVCRPFLFC